MNPYIFHYKQLQVFASWNHQIDLKVNIYDYMCKLIYSSEIQISAIENSCGSMEFENLLGKAI